MRTFTHERCKGKTFDAVWFLACDEAEREATERHWIRTLCPVHNKQWNPRPNPEYPGWGKDPDAESKPCITLPAEYLAALRDIKAARGFPLTVLGQTALELFFRAAGQPFSESWPGAVDDLVAKLRQ